jgi:hypothetical protein
MHVIIALLCLFILLSISPTVRRLLAAAILIGAVAYALQCMKTPIAAAAQAAIAGASDASNERTKACQTRTAKGLACLNLRAADLPSSLTSRSVPKMPVEHLTQPRTVVSIPSKEPVFANHNGSVMQIFALDDGSIDIVYAYPRQGMRELVAPGTLYLRGQWSEGILYATAHVFSHQCGPTPYHVSGGIEPNGVLVLNGPAPLVDPQTCQVLQWIWSDNSTIMFLPFNRK